MVGSECGINDIKAWDVFLAHVSGPLVPTEHDVNTYLSIVGNCVHDLAFSRIKRRSPSLNDLTLVSWTWTSLSTNAIHNRQISIWQSTFEIWRNKGFMDVAPTNLQQLCHMTLLTSSLLKGVEFPHWKFLMGCPCETFDTTSFLFSLSQIPTWSISISFWVWYSRCLSNFLHSLTLHKVLKLEIFLYCFIFCLLGFWYSVQRTEAKKKKCLYWIPLWVNYILHENPDRNGRLVGNVLVHSAIKSQVQM